MAPVVLVAIAVAAGTALFGSMAFQSIEPAREAILSPLEEACRQIANEGYKIHALYPDTGPEDLPEAEVERMLYLDEQWMTRCVAVLPAESILEIADSVQRTLGE